MEPLIPKEKIEELFKKAGIDKMPSKEELYQMMNSYESKVPNFLYRYTSIYRLNQLLEENQIFVQTPAKMNDVFDFQPLFDYSIDKEGIEICLNELDKRKFFKDDHQKKETLKRLTTSNNDANQKLMKDYFGELFIKLFEERKYCTKILCFTENYYNQLLWAHYGDNYGGACIQFNFNGMDNLSRNNVQRVKYIDETPTLNIYQVFTNPMHYLGSLVKSMTVKNSDWEYEKEWRLVLSDQFGTWCDKSYVPLRPNFISLIIFGVRTKFDEIMETIKLVKDRQIQLFKCYMDEKRSRKFIFGHIDIPKTIESGSLKIIDFYTGFEQTNTTGNKV